METNRKKKKKKVNEFCERTYGCVHTHTCAQTATDMGPIRTHTLMSIAPHYGRRERGLDGGKRREGDGGAQQMGGKMRVQTKKEKSAEHICSLLSLFSLSLRLKRGKNEEEEDSSLSVLLLARPNRASEQKRMRVGSKEKEFQIGKMKKGTSRKVGRRGKWIREEEEGGKPHLKRPAQEKVLREEGRRDTHNSTELS